MPGMLELLELVPEQDDFESQLASMDPDGKVSKRLFYELAGCVQGDAIRAMRRVTKGDGVAAWAELRSKYASSAETRKAMLIARLYQDRIVKNETDVQNYIDEVEDIRRQLSDAGVEIDDAMVLGRIKRSLPPSFRPLLAALQLHRKDSTSTYTTTIDEIKLWCQQVRVDEEDEPTRNLALVARATFQKKGVARDANQGSHDGVRSALECFYCHGAHKKVDCKLFKRDQECAIKEAKMERASTATFNVNFEKQLKYADPSTSNF